jgi:hypothetical protein
MRRLFLFVFMVNLMLPSNTSYSQDGSNALYWPETGATITVPDGLSLLEFEDGVILTNMDISIERFQDNAALSEGDILTRIVSMQGKDERPTAAAYAEEGD